MKITKEQKNGLLNYGAYTLIALAIDMYFNHKHSGVYFDMSSVLVVVFFAIIAVYKLFIKKS